MVLYDDEILKSIRKNNIPKNIFAHINNAFIALDATKDLTLFDIKKIQGDFDRNYYRLRKGKYRAIFYLEEDDVIVIKLNKREDIYRK